METKLYEIAEIEKIYPNWYKPDHELSRDDQQFIWENIPLSEENQQRLQKQETNADVNAYEGVNGTCRFGVNSGSLWCGVDLFFQLKQCTSKTPPKTTASILEKIFQLWPSKEGHWLSIAQSFTARTINWVMSATIKEFLRGGIKKTPAHYFTYRILRRTKRKTTEPKEVLG